MTGEPGGTGSRGDSHPGAQPARVPAESCERHKPAPPRLQLPEEWLHEELLRVSPGGRPVHFTMRVPCTSGSVDALVSLSACLMSLVAILYAAPQLCRNTEMFVSAKKMLVFKSPDEGVSIEKTNPEHPRHTSAAATMTPPRRVLRKASLDATPHLYTPVRTQNASAALELLSRSAPPASRPDYFARASTTPSKRAVNGDAFSRPATERSNAPPPFTKRKHPKVSARPLFMDRIEEVDAAERLAALPSIDRTLEQDFGSGDLREPSLAKLCRSLLNAAMTVDTSGSDSEAFQPRTTHNSQHNGDISRLDQLREENDVVMSEVGVDDLLCEELIETSNEHSSSSSQEEPSMESQTKQAAKNRNRSIAAAQERAVLQEVSVWLRNITTAVLPTNGTAASRQF